MTAPPLTGNSAQMGDVKIDAISGGDTVTYEGVPFGQVAELLTRYFDKEPQFREMQAKAFERSQQSLEAQLRQMSGVLGHLTTVLVVQVALLSLLLFTMIGLLLMRAV